MTLHCRPLNVCRLRYPFRSEAGKLSCTAHLLEFIAVVVVVVVVVVVRIISRVKQTFITKNAEAARTLP